MNTPPARPGPDAVIVTAPRSPLRRPSALCLLDVETAETVLGPAEEADLGRMLAWVGPRISPEDFLSTFETMPSVEVLVTGWHAPVLDQRLLDRLSGLRLVLHAAGSIRNIATDALWRRGVRVTTAASMNAIPVAEYTLSQILFSLKHGWQRVFEVKARTHFRKFTDLMPGAFRSTVGLLSLGHAGRIVAEHLRHFDLQVIAYDPLMTPEKARVLGVELCSLEDVFARAHVVSCHTPHLPETTRLLRGRHFARMRAGATFINTARGGVVHEAEMIEVLRSRPDLFAILDVTFPEPPADDSPLRTLENVIITPHIAGSLGREGWRLGRMMVEELDRYLRGEALRGEVRQEQITYLA